MMKILHVIPSVSPLRGGPSKSVLGMVKALNQLGHEAEILTTNDHGLDLLDVPLNSLIDWEGVPVRFFNRFSPNISSIREYSFSAPLLQWLWRNINSYDLLHVHAIFSAPSTMAMVIARMKKVPYLIRPPGQLCEWALGHRGWKKQIYLNLIERSNLNHSQRIHFVSFKEQSEAARFLIAVQFCASSSHYPIIKRLFYS
jgi:glycosyltransferase involved in cell wall biosynthesis